jgi:hypothetical protein
MRAATRAAHGTPLPPSRRPAHDRAEAEARGVLSMDRFAAAWAEGAALSLEEAVRLALQLTPDT